MFRRLIRLGSFPACFGQANVTHIPKGLPSSVVNYRPLSITSVLTKVFEHLVLVRLRRFMVCFQPPSLLIGKVWVPVMHFHACPIHGKVHWRVGEARIKQIDFSATSDRVNHQGILNKLCSVGIGGSVFLSNRSQHITVDSCRSTLVKVSQVKQSSLLGQLLFYLYTSEFLSILENKLIG